MPRTFAEVWAEFKTEYGARNQRLAEELEGGWRELQSLLEEQPAAAALLDSWQTEPGRIASFQSLFEEAGRELLAEPVEAFHQSRIQQRVLEAIEAYQAGLDDLVRRLPPSVSISGRELAETLGANELRWYLSWRRWQRKPRDFPLRTLVQDHLRKQGLERGRLEGTLLLLLAQGSLELNTPWQILRREALRRLAGSPPDPETMRESRQQWLRHLGDYTGRAERTLAALRAWEQAAPAEAAYLLGGRGPSTEERRNEEADRRQSYFSYWSRQRRAVAEVLNLDLDTVRTALGACEEAQRSLDSLEAEHRNLLAELDFVIGWLEVRQKGEPAGSFPPPQAQLVSAEERVADYLRAISSVARAHVPLAMETIAPRRALPGRRSPWREIAPQRELLETFQGVTQRVALEGFREVEAVHRAIVREIERARQVVAFGQETVQREGEAGLEVAREAVANALSLVQYQKQSAGEVRPAAERSLVIGLAAAFEQFHVSLEQGRLGLWAHLVRHGGRRAAVLAWELGVGGAQKATIRTRNAGRRLYHRVLVQIGWEPAPPARMEHVTRRGYLSESLRLDLRARDLPAIYRRLFRIEPVEDPRFLVGREAEMGALAELRDLWESRKPVAAIVVGERGSGKTSLLNCGVSKVFSSVELVRGQFHERIRTSEEMYRFLRGLLGIAEGKEIQAALAGRRQVVILEELERAFLRKLGGYEGLEELLSLIAATSHQVLWILAVNQIAFRFLSAAVGLGRFFSHRINAMSVEPEALRSAILLRHNLSGLRLHFASPPDGARRTVRLRRMLGLEQGAEEVFFDALYQESEGVFRAAFDLWQRHIERAEGGVLYMRPPVKPDYEALVSGFRVQDFFTLQAMLQHGSLTAEEISAIFDMPEQQSRRQLDTLQATELVQPDPARPGLRVRPEAGHVVRQALYSRNLL